MVTIIATQGVIPLYWVMDFFGSEDIQTELLHTEQQD